MNDNEFTDDHMRALLAEHDEPQPSPINDVPCTIYADPGVFVVSQVGAWTHTPQGIFATGYWTRGGHGAPAATETDVLIPYERIGYIEFDFAALERYHASRAQIEAPLSAHEAEREAHPENERRPQ